MEETAQDSVENVGIIVTDNSWFKIKIMKASFTIYHSRSPSQMSTEVSDIWLKNIIDYIRLDDLTSYDNVVVDM